MTSALFTETAPALTAYQAQILSVLDGLSIRFRNTSNGVIAVEAAVGAASERGTARAIRVRFEEDAVVYIMAGEMAARGFWSDGTELTLCNTSAAVVTATLQALLAEEVAR